jgi:hypothetical protein
MNPEIIKAMNRKNEKHPVRDWWRKNGYKVCRVVLFPIWWPMRMWERLYSKWYTAQNANQVWSQARANEILSYYIPRRANWVDKEKTFLFFDNGMGWNFHSAKKYLKWKDRRWWKKFAGLWGGDIRNYLINKFEMEGFTKEVYNCLDGWTEVGFVLKEGRE